jgi:hypothetical protein
MALFEDGKADSTQKQGPAKEACLARIGKQPLPPIRNARKSVKNSHTSPKEIERHEKIAEAMHYRRSGYSYPAMAKALKINQATAYRLVLRGMRAIIQQPTEDVLQLELARIDEMLTGVYARAVKGDLRAIDRVLRLQERRARFLGLDKIDGPPSPPVGPISVTYVGVDTRPRPETKS